MSKRATTPELIDLGSTHYSAEEYNGCLVQLGRIGSLLGGDRATFWAFDQLPVLPNSILDVGCGGGQLTIQLAKKYPNARVKGIDLSSDAIAFAKNQLKHESPSVQVEFSVPPTAQLEGLHHEFDIVTSTLVCHHLTDDDIVDFLKRSVLVAKKAVIINDLHRHPLASLGFFILTPFFRNRLIYHDGLLSIKRAFTRTDWENYLCLAGIPSQAWSLTWHWAFRWILVIDPGKM
jgi:2-polyprenyl-3-methyl-5-hydroxy-6-metoxy-1,4-benzoquinol methylase